jgi:hypothetical protein
MNIFNFLKKEEYHLGMNLELDGSYQIIELKKINQSYFPIYSTSGIIEGFIENGIFRKKVFINELKKHLPQLKSRSLKINSFENPKLRDEIRSALRIVGFEKISIISEKNIEGVILDEKQPAEELTLFFSQPESIFYKTEGGFIIEKEKIENQKMNIAKIMEIGNKLKQKHVFMAGANENIFEPLENIFYQAGLKVHQRNIWKNFLDFADGIPSIFPEETYKFIKVLSLTVPNLKK